MRILSIIFIIFSLASCQKNGETREFANYLSENFQKLISEEPSVFVLMPSNQCPNCVSIDGEKIPENLKPNTYFISSFPKSFFKNVENYLPDEDDRMLRMRLLNYDSRIILCKNREVVGNIPLRDFYAQIDSLQHFR